jgi:hypothetical protein
MKYAKRRTQESPFIKHNHHQNPHEEDEEEKEKTHKHLVTFYSFSTDIM